MDVEINEIHSKCQHSSTCRLVPYIFSFQFLVYIKLFSILNLYSFDCFFFLEDLIFEKKPSDVLKCTC